MSRKLSTKDNKMGLGNIFNAIPKKLDDELCNILLQHGDVKIERIVSKGHVSPESGWYDQNHNEWVLVVKGEAILTLENADQIHLKEGAYYSLPAHTKHKVSWTDPDIETVWLAVHY